MRDILKQINSGQWQSREERSVFENRLILVAMFLGIVVSCAATMLNAPSTASGTTGAGAMDAIISGDCAGRHELSRINTSLKERTNR